MYNTPKVTEYITGVKSRFEDHNTVQRTKNLHKYITDHGFDVKARTDLELIDSQTT